jgi:hypothetical protein
VELVASQLEREPEHGQALARALRVPDDSAALGRRARLARAIDRLVDGGVLLVAAELADLPADAGVVLEDDKVAEDVEDVVRVQQAEKEDVLRGRGSAEGGLDGGIGARVDALPLGEEARRGADRAVDSGLPAGANHDLNGLEEARHATLAVVITELLVAVKLLDRLGLPLVAERRALALDYAQRDPVHEDDQVGDDLGLGSLEAVLPGDEELVAFGLLEVEESDVVAPLALAAVLLERRAVGQEGVELLARLDQAGGLDVGYSADGLVKIVVGDPGVELLERLAQAAHEDGLIQRGALGLEDFRGNVDVAEVLREDLNGGVLGEAEFVPFLAWLASHADSSSD